MRFRGHQTSVLNSLKFHMTIFTYLHCGPVIWRRFSDNIWGSFSFVSRVQMNRMITFQVNTLWSFFIIQKYFLHIRSKKYPHRYQFRHFVIFLRLVIFSNEKQFTWASVVPINMYIIQSNGLRERRKLFFFLSFALSTEAKTNILFFPLVRFATVWRLIYRN